MQVEHLTRNRPIVRGKIRPPGRTAAPRVICLHRTDMTRMIVAISIFRLAGLWAEPSLTDQQIHQLVSGSAATVTAAVPGQLRVVTWNIERGVRFLAIVSTLKRLEADVILLQEVDRFADRSGNRDVASDLAQ